MPFDDTFLNTVSRGRFLRVVKNNLYNSSPLWHKVFEGGNAQEAAGTQLEWGVVLVKHGSVGVFDPYDTFAIQPINPVRKAILQPARYYAGLSISGSEERRNTGSEEKLLDALKLQFDNAMSTLKELLYTATYGDGTPVNGKQTLQGLRAAVNNTGTYANISRADYPNWQANVDSTAYSTANLKDPTLSSYLPSLMRTMFTAATHDHAPSLLIGTKKIYNLYQDIVGVQNLRVDQKTAEAGFANVQFQTATFVFDDFCPAGYLYFLAPEDWGIFTYPGANFDMPPEGWQRPPTQDVKTTQILWEGQIRLDSPWHQAVLTNLANT